MSVNFVVKLMGRMLEITDRHVLLCAPGERNAVVVDLRVALSGRQYTLRDEESIDDRITPRQARPPPATAHERAALRSTKPGRQPLTLGRLMWIDVTGWLYPLPDELRRERVVRQWMRGRERTNLVVGLLEAIHVQNGFEPPRHFDMTSVYDELDDGDDQHTITVQ